jgi:Anti-sigma-K factor rskA
VPQHCDPDVLALLALGESVGSVDEASHLASCAHCQSEVDQLRAVVAASRSVEAADRPEAPPARVWQKVADELSLSDGDALAQGGSVPRGGAPVPLRVVGRRGPSWRLLAVTSVAAGLIGVLATLGVVALFSDGNPATPVVARASLAPLPEHSGSGTATVVGTGARRALDVDVSGLGPIDGYYEVWLLDANGKKLVSLGLLRGPHGRFALPASVNISAYPLVDVSIEPADGNPAHSGNSVVRGRLAS